MAKKRKKKPVVYLAPRGRGQFTLAEIRRAVRAVIAARLHRQKETVWPNE